jgi:hypothetical protein
LVWATRKGDALSRQLAIVASALGGLWLLSIAVQFLFVAGLQGIAALIIAIVMQIAVFLVSGSLLLVTNTRRPRGVDPDERSPDPFGQTSEELRRSVALPDGRLYGRRKVDDRNVVERLSDILEEEAAKREPPQSTPQWALNLQQHDDAADVFGDSPKEES